ncbi:MAG: hypothetical protein CM1200mP2_31440 [Planctomycetaceae bacterium]|nr:MAG: hypothetical protein CM1200mP2_31440 [Planctomycetaceae bacterium]
MALLPNGTLVLEFLHRYPDDVAKTGNRARISDDTGKTWRDETYILSQGNSKDIDSGSCYPRDHRHAQRDADQHLCQLGQRPDATGSRPLETAFCDARRAKTPPRKKSRTFVNSLGMKMIGWKPSLLIPGHRT